MPKFSYLLKSLVILFILISCSTPETIPSGNSQDSKSADAFQINKENNSFKKIDPKVVPPASQTTEAPKKTGPKKPLFDWPVWEARMSRGFLPKGTKRRRRPHKGIDLAAARGVPVLASHDGIVIYTGKDFNGFGKMIMIETTGDDVGYATLYGHLDKIVVYDGQKINQGEVIGALGNTGRSSGPHLHFEVRRSDGIPIDPLPLLPAGKDLTNDVDDLTAPEE